MCELFFYLDRVVPVITGPLTINVTHLVPYNFTITATSNSSNLTYFIITNHTSVFTLLDPKTGLVQVNPVTAVFAVIIGVEDEYKNSAIAQPVIGYCYCLNNGVCNNDVLAKSVNGKFIEIFFYVNCWVK